jgi:hypothetical protein
VEWNASRERERERERKGEGGEGRWGCFEGKG